MQQIIVTGNPIEGFQYWGPFDEFDDEIASQFEGESEWWVAGIRPIIVNACRNCDKPTRSEYCSSLCEDMYKHPAPRDDRDYYTEAP